MKYTIHLYLIILTVVVIAMAWITGQFDNRPIQITIVLLALLSGIAVVAHHSAQTEVSVESLTSRRV